MAASELPLDVSNDLEPPMPPFPLPCMANFASMNPNKRGPVELGVANAARDDPHMSLVVTGAGHMLHERKSEARHPGDSEVVFFSWAKTTSHSCAPHWMKASIPHAPKISEGAPPKRKIEDHLSRPDLMNVMILPRRPQRCRGRDH